MQREEKDTLLNDEYARVPFSLIAILLVIMTGFTVAIQRDIQQTTIETKISELEIELVEELAESNQLVISTTAEATAMRVLEQHQWIDSTLDDTEELFSSQMETTLLAYYSIDEPLNIEGYNIYLKPESTNFHLDKLTMSTDEQDQVSASGGDSDKERGVQSLPYCYRVIGETTMVIISPGGVSTFERTLIIDRIIDIPAPLAEDRMSVLESKLSDGESGLARITKDVLTSLAQQRALGGWGAYEKDVDNPIDSSWTPYQDVDNLISENDIELAVSLGLVFLTAREFRTVDMPALATIHPDLPSIVSSYMQSNDGKVQPARVAMVINDLIPAPGDTSISSTFDFNKILERIIRTISDYYVEVLFEDFFRGFEGIASASEGAEGATLWDSFLNGLSGEDHHSNVFQEFTRNAYFYADDEHGILDNSTLFYQKGLSPHLYLLADGSPQNSETTSMGNGVSISWDDLGHYWYEDVGNCGYSDSNGNYHHRDWWQKKYWEVSISPNTQYPIKFAVIDAFDVADDGVWKNSADSFVESLHSSDGTSTIKSEFLLVFESFIDNITSDLEVSSQGPVYSYDDQTNHPIKITLNNFDERTTALVNILTGSSGVQYLRTYLIGPLFDLVVDYFSQITDFFTPDNYDLLTGWYTDSGDESILTALLGLFGFQATSHKESVRKNAAESLRDSSTVSPQSQGSTTCNSSRPGASSVDPTDAKDRMYDDYLKNDNWKNVLDSEINQVYESLKQDDLDRLQELTELWDPQPNWWNSPIGVKMDGFVISSNGGGIGTNYGDVDGQRTFIDLVLASSEHLVENVEGQFEDSNLMQEVALHDKPFLFWMGDKNASKENLTTRTTSFRLVGSAGMPPLNLVNYDDESSNSNHESMISQRRQQTEGDGSEAFYGFLSKAKGEHVADLSTNDIDGAYRTEYDLTVIGRKVISVETIEDVIRASSGNEYLGISQTVNIDFTIGISVTTGWAMFDPENISAKLEGHILDNANGDESSTITDDALWDQIKMVWGWIKDILDLIIELVFNPASAIIRIAGDVLELFVDSLVNKFGELIVDSLSNLLTTKMQEWSNDIDLTIYQVFSLFGFEWKWCYPGFENVNQGAVPSNILSSGDWCEKTILGESVELFIQISSSPIFGGTGFNGYDKGTTLSLYILEATNNQSVDYTVIAKLERVTDDSYLNVMVDPIKEKMSPHSLELNYYSDETWQSGGQVDDGFHLHIHAPHQHEGDFLRISTRDLGIPLEVPIGSMKVGIEAGFEIRYDPSVFSSSSQTIIDIFSDASDVALSRVGQVETKDDAILYLRVFIDQVVRAITQWLQQGVHEITFFLEGYFGAVGSSGRAGIRIAFTAGNEAVDSVLQWVADSVSFYLGQLGEGQSSNPTFPSHIVNDLWISVGALTGTNNNFITLEGSCDVPTCRSLIDSDYNVQEQHGKFRFFKLEDKGNQGWNEEVYGFGTLAAPLSPEIVSAL